MPTQRRQSTEAEASALASAIRVRIIRLTYADALTNKEIAERLGRDPATTLYHVRKLVDTGFLVAQPPRKGNRGAKEIPYLSTGLSWKLDHGALRQGVSEAILQAYLAEAAETEPGELDQTRLVVSLPAAQQEEFRSRLKALLEEFAQRTRSPDAERMAIYVATYPSR